MKIQFKKGDLAEPLTIASYFLSSGMTLPVLSNILIETKKENVDIISTDLDISAKITCKVEKIIEGGKVAVHKKIVSLIKEFPDVEMTLESEKNNNIKLSCLKSKYNIPGFPPEEFSTLQPEGKNLESIKISQKLFLNIIKMISYAALKDSSKRNLNGIFIKFEGKEMETVATDAHRLAFFKTEIKEPVKTKFEYIIPLKTINEIAKILKDDEEKNIEINLYEKVVEFKIDNIQIISRIIDENYPNYKQVIPKEFSMKALINKEELNSAIKRAITITSEKARIIVFKFEKDKLFLNSSSQDEGEAFEEIDVKYDGEPFEVSYNANYLIDVLKVIDEDEIELNMMSSMNPGLIKVPEKENFLYIIMPIRK